MLVEFIVSHLLQLVLIVKTLVKSKRSFADSPGRVRLLYEIAEIQKHKHELPKYRKEAKKRTQVMKLEH